MKKVRNFCLANVLIKTEKKSRDVNDNTFLVKGLDKDFYSGRTSAKSDERLTANATKNS